ncbi:hypothetical protein SNEBB_004119 [Seison nebaliae]|nr:hypothetical protein SNEBB_004119 [Seison nebaliae]
MRRILIILLFQILLITIIQCQEDSFDDDDEEEEFGNAKRKQDMSNSDKIRGQIEKEERDTAEGRLSAAQTLDDWKYQQKHKLRDNQVSEMARMAEVNDVDGANGHFEMKISGRTPNQLIPGMYSPQARYADAQLYKMYGASATGSTGIGSTAHAAWPYPPFASPMMPGMYPQTGSVAQDMGKTPDGHRRLMLLVPPNTGARVTMKKNDNRVEKSILV